jgi:hypothetical protein
VNSSRKGFNRFAVVAFAASACIAFAVQAQMPDPNMQPPQPQPPPKQNPFKQLFAGTLSAVLQTTGVGLATGLTQVMTGAIQNWFNKPPKAPANVVADPSAGMGGMGAMPTGMTDPMGGMQTSTGMPGVTSDPMGGMTTSPAAPMGGGMPMTETQTGMMQRPAEMQPAAMPPSLYAGLAYEVHAIGRSGEVRTIDPATHFFATGDRFVVMYRPSLPGQVALYNVTLDREGRPLGPEKLIDTVNVAAGELTRLGPYEFRYNSGNEVLRLVLTACRNDALMATTRDIVKVEDVPVAAQAAAAAPAINFQNCSNVAARGVDGPQPRDIVKVSSEEGTMFALDPVSPQEIQAGNIAPRELTLTFNHR